MSGTIRFRKPILRNNLAGINDNIINPYSRSFFNGISQMKSHRNTVKVYVKMLIFGNDNFVEHFTVYFSVADITVGNIFYTLHCRFNTVNLLLMKCADILAFSDLLGKPCNLAVIEFGLLFQIVFGNKPFNHKINSLTLLLFQVFDLGFKRLNINAFPNALYKANFIQHFLFQ